MASISFLEGRGGLRRPGFSLFKAPLRSTRKCQSVRNPSKGCANPVKSLAFAPCPPPDTTCDPWGQLGSSPHRYGEVAAWHAIGLAL